MYSLEMSKTETARSVVWNVLRLFLDGSVVGFGTQNILSRPGIKS